MMRMLLLHYNATQFYYLFPTDSSLEAFDVSIDLHRRHKNIENPQKNESYSTQQFGHFGTTEFSSEYRHVSSDH